MNSGCVSIWAIALQQRERDRSQKNAGRAGKIAIGYGRCTGANGSEMDRKGGEKEERNWWEGEEWKTVRGSGEEDGTRSKLWTALSR